MDNSGINLFDLGVLLIVGLSALLSFYRGFVREILSLGSWMIASIVALRFLEPATKLIKPQISSEPMAIAVAGIGLFFITLILFSILTGMIIKFLKPGDKVGLIDNLAGLAFGVARGALIIAICYFVMSKFFTDEKNYPKVVQQAMTRPYVEKCANWVATLTPAYFDKVMAENKSTLDNKAKETKHDIDKHTDENERNVKQGVENIRDKMPSIEDLQKRIREENEKH